MIRLIFSRKGQIRGLDFSLAMILFMLTMTQLLILTSTFIDGNRVRQSFNERQDFATSIGEQFLVNPGSNLGLNDWTDVSTSQLAANNWNFGISSNQSIDAFKMARMSNWSLPGWYLDYSTIQKGLNLTTNFKIKITNPIDIDIKLVTDDNVNTINVFGNTTKLGKPLPNIDIWAYVIDSTQAIAQSFGQSNSNGEFTLLATFAGALAATDFYTVVVIARSGATSQDVAITTYQRGAPAQPLSKQLSIFDPSTPSNLGYTVNITAELDAGVGSAFVTAFYPGKFLGEQNYSTGVLTQIGGTNRWTIDNLNLPQLGTAVIVVQGIQGGALNSLTYMNFPISLDDELANITQPVKLPLATSTSSFLSISVRGIIMQVEVTIWEV